MGKTRRRGEEQEEEEEEDEVCRKGEEEEVETADEVRMRLTNLAGKIMKIKLMKIRK